tara:strand:+ start:949 stop:1230 length:282 start_codon:yes stop_codon:yes gene_type:complete
MTLILNKIKEIEGILSANLKARSMKIKIIKPFDLKGNTVCKGSVLDILKSRADNMIKHGFAEETNEAFKMIFSKPKTIKANVNKIQEGLESGE